MPRRTVGDPVGGGVRHHLPDMVLQERQQLGEGGGNPLSLRNVGFLCCLDALSLHQAPLEMEGTSA